MKRYDWEHWFEIANKYKISITPWLISVNSVYSH